MLKNRKKILDDLDGNSSRGYHKNKEKIILCVSDNTKKIAGKPVDKMDPLEGVETKMKIVYDDEDSQWINNTKKGVGSVACPSSEIDALTQFETSRRKTEQDSELSEFAQGESIKQVSKDAVNASSYYFERMAIVKFFLWEGG